MCCFGSDSRKKAWPASEGIGTADSTTSRNLGCCESISSGSRYTSAMFTKTARFYDAIYGFKNYDREAEILLEMLSSKVGGSLLDVACGSGKHLERLRDHFTCEGLDLDPVLLEVAAGRLPGIP